MPATSRRSRSCARWVSRAISVIYHTSSRCGRGLLTSVVMYTMLPLAGSYWTFRESSDPQQLSTAAGQHNEAAKLISHIGSCSLSLPSLFHRHWAPTTRPDKLAVLESLSVRYQITLRCATHPSLLFQPQCTSHLPLPISVGKGCNCTLSQTYTASDSFTLSISSSLR